MASHLLLENGALQAILLPAESGRVHSLRSLRSGVEFLMQPRHQRTLSSPGMNAEFREGSCAGIEECLPTLDRSGTDTLGGPVPDHGDFWQVEWSWRSRRL